MHFELVPGKVYIKIYNREFDKSTHYYLQKQADISEIKENHGAVVKDLEAEKLCVLRQIHGIDVKEIDVSHKFEDEPVADGAVTSLSKIVIGIQTADCVPVLLSSEDGEYIAGLHCGWRSALDGIIENAADIFNKNSDKQILAVIGPSIQQSSYEVGNDYYENFISKNLDNGEFFQRKNNEKFLFDLPGFVSNKLIKNNINIMKHFSEDTYSNPNKYPSHRYSTVNNLGKYKGSILSTILKK